jgi:hypothetical protein
VLVMPTATDLKILLSVQVTGKEALQILIRNIEEGKYGRTIQMPQPSAGQLPSQVMLASQVQSLYLHI